MLQLKNLTPFAGTLMLMPDREGIDTLFAVIKGTFSLGERILPHDEQAPVIAADQHYGEPTVTSVRAPSDVCLGKPATDVLLVGSAYAPGGRPAWQMDVSFAVGPVAKTVRVSADRVWESGAGGSTMAWVTPFEQMPLVWERAFGGTTPTDKGPASHPINPVGIGFRPSGTIAPIGGARIPNLEDPATPISSPRDAPRPAGFGAVAAHWEPRRLYAGTYDATWQQHRAPYLPADFNLQFFQVAPLGLVSPRYLEGGEPVDIRGATPSGFLAFRLPALGVVTLFQLESGPQERRAVLDTVIVEPDAGRLIMVWRASVQCDKKALKVREVQAKLLPTS